jgi:hypothetical protein
MAQKPTGHKQGCVNCLSVSHVARRVPALSAVNETIEITLKMDSIKDPTTNAELVDTARDVIITLTADEEIEGIPLTPRFTNTELSTPSNFCDTHEGECDMHPGYVESALHVYPVPCGKTTTSYTIKTRYSYTAKGVGSFYVVRDRFAVTRPTRSEIGSGPIDIIVFPDSSRYVKDEENFTVVSIYVKNRGNGNARLSKLVINQTKPTGADYLTPIAEGGRDVYCEGLATSPQTGVLEIETLPKPTLGKDDEFSIMCKFDLGNAYPALATRPYVTYYFSAKMDYRYNFKSGGQVFVDQKYGCLEGTYDESTGQWIASVPKSGWLMLHKKCIDTAGRSKWEECKNMGNKIKDSDNNEWYNFTYDDSDWNSINLPDTGWNCENCTRFYRKYIIWDGRSVVYLKVNSADGTKCYVATDSTGPSFGGRLVANITNGVELYSFSDNTLEEVHDMGERFPQCLAVAGTCAFPPFFGIECPIGYRIEGSCCYPEYCDELTEEEVVNSCSKWGGPDLWDLFWCGVAPLFCNLEQLYPCEQWYADYYYKIADPRDSANTYLDKNKPSVIACQVANVDGARRAGFTVL